MKAMTYRQKLAQVHTALGHARRLRIVDIIENTPTGLTFEQISHHSKINPSTLGHHIKILVHAGLLDKTIKGPYSIYTYDPTPLRMIQSAAPLAKAA